MKRRDFLKRTGGAWVSSLVPNVGSAGKILGAAGKGLGAAGKAASSIVPGLADKISHFRILKNGNIVPVLFSKHIANYEILAKMAGIPKSQIDAGLSAWADSNKLRDELMDSRWDSLYYDPNPADEARYNKTTGEYLRMNKAWISFRNRLQFTPEEFGEILVHSASSTDPIFKFLDSVMSDKSYVADRSGGYFDPQDSNVYSSRSGGSHRPSDEFVKRFLKSIVDEMGGAEGFKKAIIKDSYEGNFEEQKMADLWEQLLEIDGIEGIVPGLRDVVSRIVQGTREAAPEFKKKFREKHDAKRKARLKKNDSLSDPQDDSQSTSDVEPDWYDVSDDPFLRTKERFHENKIHCYTRDYEILVEATMDQVKNRIPIWSKKYFDDDVKALEILPDIIDADPTTGKYSEWLIRQWKAGTAKFPDDTYKLKGLLKTFDSKKSRLTEKDINKYSPESLEQALGEELDLTQAELKAARAGNLVVPPGSKIVIKDDPFTVVKALSPKAVMILSGGTEWCTANKDAAEEYLSAGPLFFIYENGKRFANFSFEINEFNDVNNKPLKKSALRKIMKVFRHMMITDPKIAFQYVLSVGPSAEAMEVIAKDHEAAYKYASDIIKGRWPEAEPTISSDPWTASMYAINVIKGRWPEAEPTIMTDPGVAQLYAINVIKGRWPEAEPTISSDPWAASMYAINVIKGRWPEAEPTISSDPQNALTYASDIIKGRWPEAEPTISSDPWTALTYASDIIKGRWPEAEPTIMADPKVASMYARDVIKGRWPEAEPIIMIDPITAISYAKNIIKGRWPEAEPMIMKKPSLAYNYATEVIKGRWPEAEPVILSDQLIATMYTAFRDLDKLKREGE